MKRTFTREFKRQIASQALAGEKGMAQLCREYGLCQTLVRRWREQYQQLGEAAWPDSIHPIEAAELDRPEDRIGMALGSASRMRG